jgi:light-regulated signal transduction histidine kinase (bacteriophytochrome)
MWLLTWRQVSRSSRAYARALDETRRSRDELRTAADTLEARVQERTRLLTEVNEELEALSYSVSHDLRAPLRHVSGFAELLVQQTGASSEPKVRHYVDRILRRTHEAGELIDHLLAFSRTGRVDMQVGNVAIQPMVRDIVESLPDTQKRHIEWAIGDLPVVRGDARLLRQVFANLIGNAVKYTRHRELAKIAIACQPGANEWVFTVRDNGAGFDERYADKLFKVFQRLHTSEEFEGTGIGLAIVRRIALRHGGTVWASGSVGEGASFFFSLPHVPPAAQATSTGAAA